MKRTLMLLFIMTVAAGAMAQIADPCTGAGASQPISTFSPCNCNEAQSGSSCNRSIFPNQLAADNAIHTFLTTQSNYALPTTPAAWQDVRSNNMWLDGTAGGGGVIKHEFSTEITTGPSTTVIAVVNICQVQINCNAICQDYKIIPKSGGVCGTNAFTPTLVNSSLDPSVRYRQYTVSPNTTYIISRQLYFDGNNVNCFLGWTGTDGVSSTGAKITAQHWFIWSSDALLPVTDLRLSARQLKRSVSLQWSTTQEYNTSRFEVERSNDAIQYAKIDEVAAAGNSTEKRVYSSKDEMPEAVNFYRLRSIDKDGKVSFSAVVKLVTKPGSTTTLTISPNPVKDLMMLSVESDDVKAVPYKILNPNGQAVRSGMLALQKGINNISRDMSTLPSGLYLFTTVVNEQTHSAKFLKQ